MQRDVLIMPKVAVVHAGVLVFVLTLAQPLAAQVGASFFVSKRGSDSNPGTISLPWSTIQHAANSVSAVATV
jgi:hypothetical protein